MFVTLKTEVVRAYGRRPRGIPSGFFHARRRYGLFCRTLKKPI
uniref:Uncharacterized protein n=1 Tax=Siphoviridae sp. ct6oU4 TaxID=2826299 RepID=A0A8S5QR38_9CAUD|nr:MAG TPA: hypothetical protein [Siphoviridae sp. ct6oU4]DAP80030.1 MAG TPA: hypothetical protein [Caudoviricetes sp.]